MTTRAAYGSSTDLVFITLRELGTATRNELMDATGLEYSKLHQALLGLMRVSKATGLRRIHIASWTRELEGHRDCVRPVYSLGHGMDAPRIKAKSQRDVSKDKYERKKQRSGLGIELQQVWR